MGPLRLLRLHLRGEYKSKSVIRLFHSLRERDVLWGTSALCDWLTNINWYRENATAGQSWSQSMSRRFNIHIEQRMSKCAGPRQHWVTSIATYCCSEQSLILQSLPYLVYQALNGDENGREIVEQWKVGIMDKCTAFFTVLQLLHSQWVTFRPVVSSW